MDGRRPTAAHVFLVLAASALIAASVPPRHATASDSDAKPDAKPGEAVGNTEHGFRLTVPPELAVAKSPSKQTIVQLVNRSPQPGSSFRESVQVRLESSRPLPGVSLEAAAKGLRGSMQKHGIKILETTDAKLGGLDAKRIVYAHRLKTPQVEADVKAVIYIAIRNDWTYGVDVRATEQTYDAFLPVGQKVLDSFKWTEGDEGAPPDQKPPADEKAVK